MVNRRTLAEPGEEGATARVRKSPEEREQAAEMRLAAVQLRNAAERVATGNNYEAARKSIIEALELVNKRLGNAPGAMD